MIRTGNEKVRTAAGFLVVSGVPFGIVPGRPK